MVLMAAILSWEGRRWERTAGRGRREGGLAQGVVDLQRCVTSRREDELPFIHVHRSMKGGDEGHRWPRRNCRRIVYET